MSPYIMKNLSGFTAKTLTKIIPRRPFYYNTAVKVTLMPSEDAKICPL